MKKREPHQKLPAPSLEDRFRQFALGVSCWAGSMEASALACLVILAWAVSGPVFNFSDSWQLYVNTFTTLVTFLMVFIIQATQNRDSVAIHLKLDELIRSSKARNEFIDAEDLPEQQVEKLRQKVKSK